MKITKKELLDMGACEDRLGRVLEQVEDAESVVNVSDLVGGEITYSDLLWLAGKKFTSARLVRLACDCALINIGLIKEYTENLVLVEEFLINPSADCIAASDAAECTSVNVAMDAIFWAVYASREYANLICVLSFAVESAAKISTDSRQQVDELLREMFNEID